MAAEILRSRHKIPEIISHHDIESGTFSIKLDDEDDSEDEDDVDEVAPPYRSVVDVSESFPYLWQSSSRVTLPPSYQWRDGDQLDESVPERRVDRGGHISGWLRDWGISLLSKFPTS